MMLAKRKVASRKCEGAFGFAASRAKENAPRNEPGGVDLLGLSAA
jgi:hypothetical protein